MFKIQRRFLKPFIKPNIRVSRVFLKLLTFKINREFPKPPTKANILLNLPVTQLLSMELKTKARLLGLLNITLSTWEEWIKI